MLSDSAHPTQCSLVIGAAGLTGSSLCRALAGRGSRLLLPYQQARKETLHLASQVAARDAVVLPLSFNLENMDWDMLFARAVEDFGRIDVVAYCLLDSADMEPPMDHYLMLQSCARKANPILGKNKPGGHFLVCCPNYESPADEAGCRMQEKLSILVRDLANEWVEGKSRARINMVFVPESLSESVLRPWIQDFSRRHDIMGQVIRAGSAINIV